MNGTPGCDLKRRPLRFAGWILLLLFLLMASAHSARAGEIKGWVRDSSGAPLVLANVVVENTRLGAATDLKGNYYILAVSPGRYTVRISAVGYRAKRIEEVVVVSGESTVLNVNLSPEAVHLEPVTVTYKRPPVDLNSASQRVSIEGDVVRELPITRAEDLVRFQAGVTVDANGEAHVRGGRSGEVGYYIDGMRVEDPIDNVLAVRVGRESLQEIQLLTGTFSAEYGQAMSGIVNIVTREGGETYGGSVEVETPMLNAGPYRKADWAGPGTDSMRDRGTGKSLYQPTDVLDDPNLDPLIRYPGRFSVTLHGPVPFVPKTTFFVHGLQELENSYLPFGDLYARRLTGKLASNMKVGKLTLSFGFRDDNRQDYNHAWKYIPQHYPRHRELDQRVSLDWTQSLTRNFFYEVILGVYQRATQLKVFDDWYQYLRNNYPPHNLYNINFFAYPNEWSNTWLDSHSDVQSLSTRFTWQLTQAQQWRFGIDLRETALTMANLRYHTEVNYFGQIIYKYFIDSYHQKPVERAAFIQDKIQFQDLVLHAGLRYDYVDPRAEGWSDPGNPTYDLKRVKPSQQVSPRAGVAFLVNDKTTLHFSYGQFFQFPDYSALYVNSSELDPDTLSHRNFDAIGNPGLKPERTIAYETGLKGLLTPYWGYTVTGFYKDIYDLVGTRQVKSPSGDFNYAEIVNLEYASVIGFEVGINHVLSDYWSLEANYTFSVARGSASNLLTGYDNAQVGEDDRQYYADIKYVAEDYYMDFDRRHVLNGVITWQAGEKHYPRLFGTSLLKGVSAGLLANVASGLPYTEYYVQNGPPVHLNGKRIGSTARVDLRLAKALLFRPVKVTLFATVDNLFDRRNPLTVDRTTGKPWETTRTGGEVLFDEVHDPSRVDIPRIVRMGLLIQM